MQIAKAIGITSSSVGRWKSGGVAPSQAAALARHYGRPVLEAFVEAGFLSEEEARQRVVRADLTQIDDAELLAEISRRLELAHRAYVHERDTPADPGDATVVSHPQWWQGMAARRGEPDHDD
ncbi:hypothetical protein GUJ16_13470 [Enterococcus hirae]|nr:hypothetical protein [Enterococcus hirae]